MTKTLVIHPADGSTDFLKPIYEKIENKTVITGIPVMDIKEVDELIKSHDRVIMLGHGCPNGLFSLNRFTNARGLVIAYETADLLREKENNVYIWCNADEYVKRMNLKGFYSGMFISEVSEAGYCKIPGKFCNKTVVRTSNDEFSKILGNNINEPKERIIENVRGEYGVLAENNPVAMYNNERLYIR